MIKILLRQKRILIQYAISMFMILSVLLLYITSFVQFNLNEIKKDELLKNEQNLIKAENTIILNRINRISGDLLYLADSFRLNDTENNDYSKIENQWLAFSNRKMIYDQIRFIDLNGNEIIRVNYNNKAFLVDKSNLQNKKDRYYFADSIELKENQIYISKLDLNIENDEIEQPLKPIIRISTPYFAEGQLKGIIVINYLANDMLNQVEKAAEMSNGCVYLLNTDSYWLYNSNDIAKEWSFMYKDKADIRFSNEFSEEWDIINNQNKKSVNYLISNKGVFLYSNVISNQSFTIDNPMYTYIFDIGDWILISHLPSDSANGSLFQQDFFKTLIYILKKDYYFYIFIMLMSITIASFIAINRNEKEQIKYFSEYDEMTGVYNRRAGYAKLSQLYKKCSNKSCLTSICFIDINGLKVVNDTLGHEAGDELIISVILGIKKNTRETDYIARLGGDEFLIIFDGLNENESEEIWKNILEEYNNINETENRKYLISVSHGIESFECNSNEYIGKILNLADEKMYNEKKLIKKNLNVLRNNDML